MRKTLTGLLFVSILMVGALAIAWATSPDPRGNPASFEDDPPQAIIAPLDRAVTLASYLTSDGARATLLVTSSEGDAVSGVDLVAIGGVRTGNPLRDFNGVEPSLLQPAALDNLPKISVPIADLLPAAPGGDRHIGTGTNFPEHAEEANSDSVFQFPKFGTATPPRTTIRAQEGVLLDYEVELCMRFDRNIASLDDFDAATKGVFLCSDFTNRNALVELADPENLDSGFGFSDAKSGPGSYPSGPFVVVPNDWQSFVANARMTTSVNGERRQDARGGEMTLDFRALTEKALKDMDEARFYYQGSFYKLAEGQWISEDTTLMSGTAEGVIFTPPTRGDIIEGLASYIFAGGPLSDTGFLDTVKQRFIANELDSGQFLGPGDIVVHGSNYLGDIEVGVTE